MANCMSKWTIKIFILKTQRKQQIFALETSCQMPQTHDLSYDCLGHIIYHMTLVIPVTERKSFSMVRPPPDHRILISACNFIFLVFTFLSLRFSQLL